MGDNVAEIIGCNRAVGVMSQAGRLSGKYKERPGWHRLLRWKLYITLAIFMAVMVAGCGSGTAGNGMLRPQARQTHPVP